MKKNSKVSVIVPVYNGEQYLRQCMDSICNQTLREIEIICVDDGSTDSSYQILKDYQENDQRIQIYQQPNLYAGAARNLGMRHATGEYLIFWDCDDYFDLSALELLYAKAVSVHADICVCGANRYFDDTGKLEPNVVYYLNTKRITDKEVFNRRTNEDFILNFTTPVPWNKLFRRAFIEQIDLQFQEVPYGNDIFFTVNALCQAETITTVNKALITYRMNVASNLTANSRKSPTLPITVWISVAENLKEREIFPEKSFVNRAVDNLVYLLRNIHTFAAFSEAVQFLDEAALKTMSIYDHQGTEYYYVNWHGDFVHALVHDTPEELQNFLASVSYSQLKRNATDKRLAAIALSQTKASEQNQKAKNAALKERLARQKEKNEKRQERIVKYKSRLDRNKEEIQAYKSQIEREVREVRKVQNELEEIRESSSYRIGRGITYLPRKIRQLFH